ncbi:L-histidine N(alpha)-methyltransferase [Pleionea sp. CnH1-48]|uniref:L-histidine N(alpha)-methyltransferase n=1 Tax=Pleionea sp. CnH1-48 TaxID=2954494 RepID=UPI0020971CC5|nr:L-histidine N(alpha)-methyltransferase [Pleionea sp. CnH1-48]MCO7226788.1 L-histidine N(alpha)-methyltransferase [Pleionea sp. CnH1-48]
MNQAVKKNNIYFHQHSPASADMMKEIHQGLSKKQKSISPKYFYNEKGSQLFDSITQLPEYYPTRTEVGLLKAHASEFAELMGKDSILLELGSGSSIKIRLLLEALKPKIYVPMDISEEHLIRSAERLAKDYPWLEIHATCVDYSKPWQVPDFGPGRYNAFFPGSSIGNFEPADAQKLLTQIAKLVGKQGGLLIGVDLKKDSNTLESAYNDKQGVTAEFNLNLLHHLNEQRDVDFDTSQFEHKALYNLDKGRIEMHLVSKENQEVQIEDKTYHFDVGETIHTENSYKYSPDEFHALAHKAGFSPEKVWIDEKNLFSIHYLKVFE